MGALFHKSLSHGVSHCLSAVADLKLAEDGSQMRFHRGFADEKRVSDLLVRVAVGHESQYFQLAFRKLAKRRFSGALRRVFRQMGEFFQDFFSQAGLYQRFSGMNDSNGSNEIIPENR